MKQFSKFLPFPVILLPMVLVVSGLLTGCLQSQAAREIRSGYTADTYLQAMETAAATRSLARELLEHDSPETIRRRLEAGLLEALEAAKYDDAGRPLQNPAILQGRTVQAVVWYEAERGALERWHTGELAKIDQLASRVESLGEAALRADAMADRELRVSREALNAFVKTGLPQIAREAVGEYLRTRNAAQVAARPTDHDGEE